MVVRTIGARLAMLLARVGYSSAHTGNLGDLSRSLMMVVSRKELHRGDA
jgi:hypothetical protein